MIIIISWALDSIFFIDISFSHCLFTHLNKWDVILLDLSVSFPLLSLCDAPCKYMFVGPTVTSVLKVFHCLVRCEQWLELLMRSCVLQSVWCLLQVCVGFRVNAVLKILFFLVARVQMFELLMRGCLVLSVWCTLQAFVWRLHSARVIKILHCFITCTVVWLYLLYNPTVFVLIYTLLFVWC
jgi:hypothetical protein